MPLLLLSPPPLPLPLWHVHVSGRSLDMIPLPGIYCTWYYVFMRWHFLRVRIANSCLHVHPSKAVRKWEGVGEDRKPPDVSFVFNHGP